VSHGPSYHWATVGSGKGGEYRWFDPSATIAHAWGRHLPHWRQDGAIYFVTFRTVDSMPQERLEQWQQERRTWLLRHPEPHDEVTRKEYARLFTNRWENWLDEGHGACPLRDVDARAIVEEVLRALDGAPDGYALDRFVIMPNHVHALVSPAQGQQLSRVTSTWKRVTAHRLNRLLQRSGGFWQQESWDHLVRSAEHLDKYRRYIERNPGHLPSR
jgi:REP element-mobilizing transposase RayT